MSYTREVFPYMRQDNGNVSVMVEMSKEAFDHLLSAYKYDWGRRDQFWLAGDDVSCMQLVRQVLRAAEEGCTDDR